MKINILIADDEAKIRLLIKKYAMHEGYNVLEAEDGEEAVEIIKKERIDLMILDVMMPKIDGFKVYQKTREFKDIPCIFLTALNEEYNRIYGFDLGADDYVAKPFSTNELMKRVKAILKRTNTVDYDSVTINNLSINKKARTVIIDNELLNITLKEYDLLLYLIEHQGVVVERETLLEKVWGEDFYGDERTLDTHIKKLRKALGDYAKYISTVRGIGYRFEKDI